jgi:hypothetical protein
MSYIIIRGRWCNIIQNVHALCEDKSDDVEDSFCEEVVLTNTVLRTGLLSFTDGGYPVSVSVCTVPHPLPVAFGVRCTRKRRNVQSDNIQLNSFKWVLVWILHMWASYQSRGLTLCTKWRETSVAVNETVSLQKMLSVSLGERCRRLTDGAAAAVGRKCSTCSARVVALFAQRERERHCYVLCCSRR